MARLLTTAEVAERCRVDPRTVTNWIARGELRAAKLGRGWRIAEEDLEAYIRDHTSALDGVA